jgi:hypothetical protein
MRKHLKFAVGLLLLHLGFANLMFMYWLKYNVFPMGYEVPLIAYGLVFFLVMTALSIKYMVDHFTRDKDKDRLENRILIDELTTRINKLEEGLSKVSFDKQLEDFDKRE